MIEREKSGRRRCLSVDRALLHGQRVTINALFDHLTRPVHSVADGPRQMKFQRNYGRRGG